MPCPIVVHNKMQIGGSVSRLFAWVLMLNAHPWVEHDLDATIFFIAEGRIHLRRFIQRDAVRHHKRWIDLAAGDEIGQGSKIAMDVCLSHYHLCRLAALFRAGRLDDGYQRIALLLMNIPLRLLDRGL